jgi:uncharacterized protein (TIGR02284 family)
MHSSNDHAVKVLNSLIETTLDSAHGYKEAAENVESSEYRSMFSERSTRRLELSRRLQAEVRSFGGEPEDDQSLAGKLHNRFVDLKTALTGGPNDKGVINEVERGEDVIKAKYEAATKDDELPTELRTKIIDACQSVKSDHDEISRIKHSMH